MKTLLIISLWILTIVAICDLVVFIHERNFFHFIGPFALNVVLIIAVLKNSKKNIDTNKKI